MQPRSPRGPRRRRKQEQDPVSDWNRSLATLELRADVAELVDAHGSGPRRSKSAFGLDLNRKLSRQSFSSEAPPGKARLRRRRLEKPRCEAKLVVRADVAELVDAHGSGPCGGNPVEVQVLSSASKRLRREAREPRRSRPTRLTLASSAYDP